MVSQTNKNTNNNTNDNTDDDDDEISETGTIPKTVRALGGTLEFLVDPLRRVSSFGSRWEGDDEDEEHDINDKHDHSALENKHAAVGKDINNNRKSQKEKTKRGKKQGSQTQQEQQQQDTAASERQPTKTQSTRASSKTTADNVTQEDMEVQEPPIKLYKSARMKGYLTVFLASIINYNAARLSNDPIGTTSVPASQTQKGYAEAVSLVSATITGLIVLAHLDRYSALQSVWSKKAFAPNSYIELGILIFLLLWWFVATIAHTSVRGIAGDGKEQHNLYYSTWVCCLTMIWTFERKLYDFGWTSLRTFVMGWPYRAPGWIAIFVSCFFTLFWYVDLYLNTSKNDAGVPETLKPFYETIPESQYQWLLFVAAFTLLPSAVFIFVEILRESTEGEVKGTLENILEGFFLMLLAFGWIPSVIVATTPGGFASLVGNAYFFTWATTVFVMETCLWFIHDFRGSVLRALQEKQDEYKRHQQEVLRQAQKVAKESGVTHDDMQARSFSIDHDTDIPSPHHAADGLEGSHRIARLKSMENDDDLHHVMDLNSSFDSPPRFADTSTQAIGNDPSVEEEMRLKETNKDDYYDRLDDIFE